MPAAVRGSGRSPLNDMLIHSSAINSSSKHARPEGRQNTAVGNSNSVSKVGSVVSGIVIATARWPGTAGGGRRLLAAESPLGGHAVGHVHFTGKVDNIAVIVVSATAASADPTARVGSALAADPRSGASASHGRRRTMGARRVAPVSALRRGAIKNGDPQASMIVVAIGICVRSVHDVVEIGVGALSTELPAAPPPRARK